jgi:hypothetical protein
MSAEPLRTRGVDWSRVRSVARDPELPPLVEQPAEPEQLELFDRWDDGLSWDEWFRSLPRNPWGER